MSEDVAFAVGLCSLDGSRIMSIDSDVPGRRYTISKGARGRATLFLDTVHLAPAVYLLDIGIRSGHDFLLDFLPGVMMVAVLPSDRTPGVIAMRQSGNGGVRYPCKTSLHLVSQSLNLEADPASAA